VFFAYRSLLAYVRRRGEERRGEREVDTLNFW